MHRGARLAPRTVAMAAGMVLWTLTEYAAHRWVLHRRRPAIAPIDPAAPHLAHHRSPLDTSTTARLAAMGGVAAAAYQASAIGVPAALAVGWASGYATYDITHWFAHHRPARTPWGADLRKRHMRHHRGAPHANFGVTVDWWDKALGTVAAPSSPAG